MQHESHSSLKGLLLDSERATVIVTSVSTHVWAVGWSLLDLRTKDGPHWPRLLCLFLTAKVMSARVVLMLSGPL